MAASKLNLRIEQGATYVGPGRYGKATLKNGTPPVPTDLTGCSARMHIREKLESTSILLELTTENGRIALGEASGTITLNLSAAETAALPWTAAVYDLELVFASGFVRRLLKGSVTVIKEVTR